MSCVLRRYKSSAVCVQNCTQLKKDQRVTEPGPFIVVSKEYWQKTHSDVTVCRSIAAKRKSFGQTRSLISFSMSRGHSKCRSVYVYFIYEAFGVWHIPDYKHLGIDLMQFMSFPMWSLLEILIYIYDRYNAMHHFIGWHLSFSKSPTYY